MLETKFDDLDRKGYFIFRNALNPLEIERGKSCVEGDRVLYSSMADFIQAKMACKLNEIMGWDSEYVKFRVSDDNNSSDASTFHRDILCHNPQKETYPVYTLLLYLDRAVMEIIPTSHKNPVADYKDALKIYRLKEKLILNPGDFLLFHSIILHRGIFTGKALHRRLIQVFEIYPTKDQYEVHAPKFLHIPVVESGLSKLMIAVSKIKPLITALNIFGYLNAVTGYGYYSKPLEKYNLSEFKYLSNEGLQERIKVEPNQWQDINKYVLQKNVNDLSEAYRKGMHFVQYGRQFLLYFVGLLATVISLILIIRKI